MKSITRWGSARVFVALMLLVGMSVAASAAASTHKRSAASINVWLQTDAKGWPDIVAAATSAFQKAHPGVNVNVTYLTWGEHLGKLDAALAAGNAPDVVEMGNTEMVKYMASGAFYTLPVSNFDNYKTWLDPLRTAAIYNGKFYGVPYYAGARAVVYRSDYWKGAGAKTVPPKSLGEFYTDGVKIMKKYGKKDPNFSALYLPGQNWYAATSWVYDFGGSIAIKSGGAWKGNLNSQKSVAGLTELKKDVLALSRADKTGTEANEWTTFSQGHVASMIANGWEVGLIIDPKAGNPALAPVVNAFPMPSHVAGRQMPTFVGGSDLAVPTSAHNKTLAIDWIKDYTSTNSERQLATQAGVIPNTKTLLTINDSKATLAPFFHASKFAWSVPVAPHWADVENAKVMQNLYVQIFTGRKSVKAAANSASAQITQILNAG
jgi:N,N'-diacetylchitobiose transport system substrate-binding protein